MPSDPGARLLHVSPSFGVGGREMRVVALMDLMSPEVTHLVCALDGRRESLERVRDDVRIRDVEAPSTAGGFLKRVGAMRAVIRDTRPDLLLTYNWGSIEWLLAARLEKCPVVHHEDGFGPDEAQRLLRRRNWLRRALLPACTAVVVPSRNLYEIGRVHWKQPTSRLLYLPNGVDLERFSPAPEHREGPVVFGCVGRVRPEKNQELAVEALARVQHLSRLRVVGDGTELEKVRALADELGVADRVDFVGNVDDTAPEYHRMDVFLIPSRTEQMPLSLLEAMGSGLPVVGTDVGDVRTMVAEENREWVGDYHDAASLSERMDEMASDVDRMHRLGSANREKAEAEFELDACYGAYIDLYGQVIGRELGRESES